MSEKGGLFGRISPANKKSPQYGYVPCPRSEEVGSDILALFQQKGKFEFFETKNLFFIQNLKCFIVYCCKFVTKIIHSRNIFPPV